MNKTAMALALAAAAGVGVAQADFRMEAGVSYTDFSPQVGAGDSAISGDFTYHLAPVKTAGHPLAEADFLERSSNLGVSYATFDDSDLDVLNLEGEFYLDRLYLRGSYSKIEDDLNNVSADIIRLRVGFVPVAGLRFAAGVNRNDSDALNSEEENDIVVEAKYVSNVGSGNAINLEADLTLADDAADTTTLALVGDFFFTPAISAGVRLASSDSDAPSGSTTDYGLGARMFFTPVLSGQIEYATDRDGDDDVVAARLALRF